VVEHGLFIGLTSEVHVGGAGGVRILTSARASRSEVTRSGKPSPA
jgi:hypothetical protein